MMANPRKGKDIDLGMRVLLHIHFPMSAIKKIKSKILNDTIMPQIMDVKQLKVGSPIQFCLYFRIHLVLLSLIL